MLAGTTDNPSNFGIVRFTAGGALDPGFGDHGVVRSVNAKWDNTLVVAQADGKFIVGGYRQMPGGLETLSIVRYNADDSVDSSFVVDPFLAKHFLIDRLSLLADGSLLASGKLDGKPAVGA